MQGEPFLPTGRGGGGGGDCGLSFSLHFFWFCSHILGCLIYQIEDVVSCPKEKYNPRSRSKNLLLDLRSSGRRRFIMSMKSSGKNTEFYFGHSLRIKMPPLQFSSFFVLANFRLLLARSIFTASYFYTCPVESRFLEPSFFRTSR